jgi:hypothetical protein
MNLTIKTAENVVGELNQLNEVSDTKRKAINTKKHIRRFLKEKMENHINL